ncbi:hypothetical protein [Mycobacterium sp. 050134]|uniref:hypothetical protein n=1 Tax=Mycobacterium sp. 050134 TaxID=3096111 RepID=UPI002EDB377A
MSLVLEVGTLFPTAFRQLSADDEFEEFCLQFARMVLKLDRHVPMRIEFKRWLTVAHRDQRRELLVTRRLGQRNSKCALNFRPLNWIAVAARPCRPRFVLRRAQLRVGRLPAAFQ